MGEVAEPYVAGRGSSSTMPQKRNPIASEYILAAARAVQALVPLMLGAMAQDHERATGPWQAEALAIPQAFVLTHGALLQARAIAEGMVVDAARMRRNLDLTHGLIVAEAVMMGLAPQLGRGEAHHVVKHACDEALERGDQPGGCAGAGAGGGGEAGPRGDRAADRSRGVSGQHRRVHRPRAGGGAGSRLKRAVRAVV